MLARRGGSGERRTRPNKGQARQHSDSVPPAQIGLSLSHPPNPLCSIAIAEQYRLLLKRPSTAGVKLPTKRPEPANPRNYYSGELLHISARAGNKELKFTAFSSLKSTGPIFPRLIANATPRLTWQPDTASPASISTRAVYAASSRTNDHRPRAATISTGVRPEPSAREPHRTMRHARWPAPSSPRRLPAPA